MIRFMKYRVFYFFISLFVILSGIFSLMMHGLTLGIDFTGGSSLQFVTSSGLSPEEMQTHIDSAIFLSMQNEALQVFFR